MLLLLRIFFVHSATRRFLLFMSSVLSTCYTTQCYATLLIAVNLIAIVLRISKIPQVKKPVIEALTSSLYYDRKVLCARTLNQMK